MTKRWFTKPWRLVTVLWDMTCQLQRADLPTGILYGFFASPVAAGVICWWIFWLPDAITLRCNGVTQSDDGRFAIRLDDNMSPAKLLNVLD